MLTRHKTSLLGTQFKRKGRKYVQAVSRDFQTCVLTLLDTFVLAGKFKFHQLKNVFGTTATALLTKIRAAPRAALGLGPGSAALDLRGFGHAAMQALPCRA